MNLVFLRTRQKVNDACEPLVEHTSTVLEWQALVVMSGISDGSAGNYEPQTYAGKTLDAFTLGKTCFNIEFI